MNDVKLPTALKKLIWQGKVDTKDAVSEEKRMMTQFASLISVRGTYPVYDKEAGMMKRVEVKENDRMKMTKILEEYERRVNPPEPPKFNVVFVSSDGTKEEMRQESK